MRCACGSSMRRDSPLFSRHVLHYKKLIWEHLDPSMNTLFSISMFSMVFLLFFNTWLSATIDLESLGRFATRSKAWERGNLGFPTTTC